MGGLRAVGGEVSDNNVGGDSDVTSGDVSSQGKGSGDLGELHCSELKRVTVGKEKSFSKEGSGEGLSFIIFWGTPRQQDVSVRQIEVEGDICMFFVFFFLPRFFFFISFCCL